MIALLLEIFNIWMLINIRDFALKLLSLLLCPNQCHRVKNGFGKLNRKFFYNDGIMRMGICCIYCEEVIAEIPDISAASSNENLSWLASSEAFNSAIAEDRKIMFATSIRKQDMLDKINKACKFGFIQKKGASWDFDRWIMQ